MRPLSITIISWLFIVGGLFGWIASLMLVGGTAMQQIAKLTPLPYALQIALMYGQILVLISSGIAMLNGMNWGRLLYLGWGTLTLLIGLVTTPSFLLVIPSAAGFAVVIFFLFRPAASDYFSMM